jgi:hypothetical protein
MLLCVKYLINTTIWRIYGKFPKIEVKLNEI